MKPFVFVLLLFIVSVSSAQQIVNLNVITLSDNGMLILQKNNSSENHDDYRLLFTDVLYKDSLIVAIDSIDHVPCGGPNSLFFINDSVGFMMESGGCYAYYNWMYRTPDRGRTWKKVVFETNTELFPSLSNKNFYMFDNLRGIIIWQVGNGNIIYSTTNDGGFTWVREMKNIGIDISIRNIDSIHFAENGQIVIVMSEYARQAIDNNPAQVFISDDYGKTFRELK